MGRFKFNKARNYKDFWIINELAEQNNEEGKDGRFRWCYTPGEHPILPYIENGRAAKLVITKDKVPKIVGFYVYEPDLRRLDVLYVVPNQRERHVALDMVDNFMRMFPGEREFYVLRPCRAVRRMLNKHYLGMFRAVSSEVGGVHLIEFEEENLGSGIGEGVYTG
jgi:hypothetical protein